MEHDQNSIVSEFLKEEQSVPAPAKHQINPQVLLLYPFRPLKSVQVYIMNRSTVLKDVVWLIDQAQQTLTFSMCARRDIETNRVASITIEFRKIDQDKSVVLVVDLLNLPEENTYLFAIIKFLLLHIFKQDKRTFVWNDRQWNDLGVLVDHQYLPRILLECIQIIRLEPLFKHWYNKIFPHNDNCFVRPTYIQDSMYCTCPQRPYKQAHDEWTLLKALAYTFNEFSYTVDEDTVGIPRTIQFSVSCCMMITKLSLGVELDWTSEQLWQFKQMHPCKSH